MSAPEAARAAVIQKLRELYEVARNAGDSALCENTRIQLCARGVDDEPPQLLEGPASPAAAPPQEELPVVVCQSCGQGCMVTPETQGAGQCPHCGEVVTFGGGDQELDRLKREWVAAKRVKDFARADVIREKIRSQYGIMAHDSWWQDKTGLAMASAGTQSPLEQLKERWCDAKRAKDFATSDFIRKQIKEEYGLDCDDAWWRYPANPAERGPFPRSSAPPAPAVYSVVPEVPAYPIAPPPPPPAAAAAAGAGYVPAVPGAQVALEQMDPESQALRQQWVAAKRARDYATSDMLRGHLKARGYLADDSWLKDEPPRVTVAAQPLQIPTRSGRPAGGYGGGRGNDNVVRELATSWVAAKRARDFGLADRLRVQLRHHGVETTDAWLHGLPTHFGAPYHDSARPY